MSTDIDIKWDQLDGVTAARLTGRLDITRAEDFEAAISERLNGTARAIVINLAQATYMSSSGIRAILAIYRLAGSLGKKVNLCEAPPVVRKVLGVVQISPILEVLEIDTSARAALQ